MEVTFSCIRLLINTWLLLVIQIWDSCDAQTASFPHVVPNTSQHYEYSTVSFDCKGFDGSLGWKLMRKAADVDTACGTSWGVFSGSICIFRNVYIEDSGQYWCESGDGKKSSPVNITITPGPVILESPLFPVMEGNTVSLHCKNRTDFTKTSTSITFYKNGIFIKSISTSTLIIHNINKSHEGLYKCNISGAGESPESWLAVRSRDNTCQSTHYWYT
ncbi:high affinity immunoglobulin gamma Fc receptor IB-like [Oreochromis niloticus]|nr:high affinity immunoglobulin gamma Fc receptor IB-like [Oreochromis niloticus]